MCKIRLSFLLAFGINFLSSAQGQLGKPPQFSELLTKMDKNKDGKLAESEVDGPLKKDFSKIDINKDGFISEEEFKKGTPPPPKEKK